MMLRLKFETHFVNKELIERMACERKRHVADLVEAAVKVRDRLDS